MIQKKVCMIGSFAVGKTSLVQRFVHSIFSEKYQTTVGVKIDKKDLEVDCELIRLISWDIAVDDPFQELPMSYLRGASGYFLVVDITRQQTLKKICTLRQDIKAHFGVVPSILALNKSDLADQYELDEEMLAALRSEDVPIIETSAKTGQGAEQAFRTLVELMQSTR